MAWSQVVRCAVAALVVAAGLLVPPASSSTAAADTGEISGVVTGAGQPRSSMNVNLYEWTGSSWSWRASSFTDADGRYSFQGRSAGDYRVGAAPGPFSPYVETFHPAADTIARGTTVRLAAGEAVDDADVALLVAGTIAGTIRDDGGRPRAGVDVVVTDTTMETRVFEATTDAEGTYVVSGLTTGTYVVRFSGHEVGLQGEYYLDAPTESLATPVVVRSGQPTSGIDATLTAPSRLSGRVTDRDTGAPVPYARVLLFEKQGAYWQPTQLDTYTDADGDYEFPGVFGSYRILVLDGYQGTHYATYHPAALAVEDAVTVEVPQGAERTVDIAMLGQASITGTARAGGLSVEDVSVYVTYWDGTAWKYWTFRELGEDGTWDVTVSTPGTYRVRYTDPQRRYADQWWEGQAAESSATSIPMDVGGVDATGIDADLAILPPMQNTTPPAVTGSPVVGQVLTASPGSWTPEPDLSLTWYRWYADGEPLSGISAGHQYVVTANDVGKRLSVRVGATAPGHARTWVTSAESAAVTSGASPTETPSPTENPSPTETPSPTQTPTQTQAASPTQTPVPEEPVIIGPVAVAPAPLAVESRPELRGRARVGATLRVTRGEWSATAGVSFSYRWLADGRRIRGATRRSLVVRPDLAGERISVRVVARQGSGPPVRVRTRATGPVRP